MKIELSFSGSQIKLIFVNPSTSDVRIWELKNSWGWFAPRFEIQQTSGDTTSATIVHTENVVWTRDVPSFVKVPAQGKYEVSVDLGDGQWDVVGQLPALNQPVRVRVRYNVETTPESSEHKVFTGTIESPWVRSEPPNTWLPAAHK